MSQNAQPHLSLLSLSIAAANAAPIPAESAVRSSLGATSNTTKHRRLSSAGRSRRRLSDARDAAIRPFATTLQTASASLAALSLSSPTTTSHRPVPGAQHVRVPRATPTKRTSDPESSNVDDTHLSLSPPQSYAPLASNSINVARSGRKRGTIFTCESCSKVYRHPSCLIKHRWEHTPQWREASKFVLSKHQQVQLLEAAAILSHISPSSASLPEDRSLWPSFLSGGLVPPPGLVLNGDTGPTPPMTTVACSLSPSTPASNVHTSSPISSSVPASALSDSYRAGLTGPRLHDYAIGGGGIGITQVRPGVLGVSSVPTSAMNGKSSPMSVPAQTVAAALMTEDDALNLLAFREADMSSGSWGSPTSASFSPSHSYSQVHPHTRAHAHSHSHSHSLSLSHASREREQRRLNMYEYGFVSGPGSGTGFGFGHHYRTSSYGYTYAPDQNGGWSLPRSSVRSKSGSSGSRSGSRSRSSSRSDDEDEGGFGDGVDAGVDLNGDMGIDGVEGGTRMRRRSYLRGWKTEVDEGEVTDISAHENEQEGTGDEKGVGGGRGAERTWNGMEMEMEMD